MRTLGRIILVLLVLVVGVVGYFVLTFDPEAYKPQIAAAVKQAIGRDLRIKGKIALAVSLTPSIEVADVALSNPPGFAGPDMASMAKMDLRLALMPLLGGRIVIDRMILTDPNVTLETDAKGNPNWIFTPPAGPAPAAALVGPAPIPTGAAPLTRGTSTPPAIAIKEIRIANGVFTYRDGRSGATNTLTVRQISVQAEAPDAPVKLSVGANLNGVAIAIDGTTGGLGHLTGAIRGEWPIKLVVAVGDAKFLLDGLVADPMTGRGLDVGLTADVPDLAALGAVAKQVAPPLKSVLFTARLSGDPGNFALRDLKLTSAAGDIAGEISLAMGLPASVTGTLTSTRLELDGLAAPAQVVPPAPAAPAAPSAPPAPAEAAAAKPKWLIPDTALPVGTLQLLNADLRLTIGALHVGQADYKSIQAHAVLKDGVLTLDPAAVDLPQGHVALTLTTDVGKPSPRCI